MEDNAFCSATIWNEGSGHMVAALYYADRGPEATPILNSVVASECALPDPNDPADKGWTHSLDTVSDSCGAHFGGDYGIHVGGSAWVYFAVESSAGDLLPYVEVPEPRGWLLLAAGLGCLVALCRVRKGRRC